MNSANSAKKYVCPACKKTIANRAVPNCIYCEKPIPKSLLFTPQELAQRKQRLEQERQQYELHDQKMSQLISRKKWWEFWKNDDKKERP